MALARNNGEVAAEPANLSLSGPGGGGDHLSDLHDDILLLILLRLPVDEAARTSLLSYRWRRTWHLLPEFAFHSAPNNLHVREVLEAHEAPVLRRVTVLTKDDTPESVAGWLPLAARRLHGCLVYRNMVERREEEGGEGESGPIALPCFGNASTIALDLGFLALALPSSGAFTQLTLLSLNRVRFQGTCELGDMVSSPRCPCLTRLLIERARGVAGLTIRSESLLQMSLSRLYGLQRLYIDAPVLEKLTLVGFARNQPTVEIAAHKLASLVWLNASHPNYIQLGNLGQLQRLGSNLIMVYGHHNTERNRELMRFLQHFQFIQSLDIVLCYPPEAIGDLQYLMNDITRLPRATFLTIYLLNRGHSFGASSFHVLRLCTGIRRLSLDLRIRHNLEAESTCPSGCICDQPTNWEIEELSLDCLQEAEINGLNGAEHEVAFLKRLFNWAVMLGKLKLTFCCCVSNSNAKEFCQRLSSISRPQTLMEFRKYQDSSWKSVELLLLEDEGTGV